MTDHPSTETLAALLTQTTISPRPWELICNRVPGHDFTTGKPIKATVPVVSSLRIVDADNRLLVRIKADSEQSLKPEDMQLIVAAVNESAALVARCEELEAERDERVGRMMFFESMATKQRERAESAEARVAELEAALDAFKDSSLVTCPLCEAEAVQPDEIASCTESGCPLAALDDPCDKDAA